jgi:hypothetical protein
MTSALTSYVWPDTNSQHVFYVGVDNHVHELTWQQSTGHWDTGDLIATIGAPNLLI